MSVKKAKVTIGLSMLLVAPATLSGVIFGSDGNLGGGYRWDADSYDFFGSERSLDNGLRYAMQGGSLSSYRDSFSWDSLPTLAQFGATIDLAFDAWISIDPVTGLSTSLYFVDDSATTSVVGNGFGQVNYIGAEIDLLVSDAGDSGRRATSYFLASSNEVTLTSGTENYSQSGAIIGADININNNPNAIYSLDFFGRLLTHEIGHAIGLGDVDTFSDTRFIDDNFDPNNPLATLTNSWALLVDPLDPGASFGLSQYSSAEIPASFFKLEGVDFLMESKGLGISSFNPISNLVPLTNDEYGMRQFLYPSLHQAVIPEPASLLSMILALGLLMRSNHHSGSVKHC